MGVLYHFAPLKSWQKVEVFEGIKHLLLVACTDKTLADICYGCITINTQVIRIDAKIYYIAQNL
jgi:thymidine kinase